MIQMDSKNPKLSVVVPTLNEENYIPNLIESLRNQSRDSGKTRHQRQ